MAILTCMDTRLTELLPKAMNIKNGDAKECLSSIPDCRVGNTVDHKLIDILVIAILRTICCADSWTDIEDFGEAKKEWLCKHNN